MQLKYLILSLFVMSYPGGADRTRPHYEINLVKDIIRVRELDPEMERDSEFDICILNAPERSALCFELLHDYVDLKHDYSSWRPAKTYNIVPLDRGRPYTIKAIRCSIDPAIYVYAKKGTHENRPSYFVILMLADDVPAHKRRRLRRQRSRTLSDFFTRIESQPGSPHRRAFGSLYSYSFS